MAKKRVSVTFGCLSAAGAHPELSGLPPLAVVLDFVLQAGSVIVRGAAMPIASPNGPDVRYFFFDEARPVPRRKKRAIERALDRSDLDAKVMQRFIRRS